MTMVSSLVVAGWTKSMTMPGLLLRGPAGDPPDALLVDAPRRRGREVHADRRPRRVPSLREQHRVAQHVHLAALECGEDLGQLALGRLAGDGLGVHARGAERGGDVVRVAHARGVDDAGDLAEARAVQVGDGDVEGLLVEEGGQLFLVEVLVHLAAAQRHLGDRPDPWSGRDPDAAKRRDDAPPGRLRKVEARGLGGEEVGDMAGDQRARRGHPDETGSGQARMQALVFSPERRVRLVADHDRVGVGDRLGVADEPLVRLDGDRAVGVVVRPEQRGREAVLVAAVGDLADELVDEVAAVGQDQDAARPRALDEAQRGDRLAGAGRVLEPEAASWRPDPRGPPRRVPPRPAPPSRAAPPRRGRPRPRPRPRSPRSSRCPRRRRPRPPLRCCCSGQRGRRSSDRRDRTPRARW